ncbi:MAG: hypothetical protein ABSC38_05765 [Verrucomicrobiia bacterium]
MRKLDQTQKSILLKMIFGSILLSLGAFANLIGKLPASILGDLLVALGLIVVFLTAKQTRAYRYRLSRPQPAVRKELSIFSWKVALSFGMLAVIGVTLGMYLIYRNRGFFDAEYLGVAAISLGLIGAIYVFAGRGLKRWMR